MGIKFANNAFATLASGINSSVTSITVTTGQGARFPTLGVGDYFYATLVDTSNNLEIVKCTARSTDVLTVVRAQESTTARAYSAGDRIEMRVTAASLAGAASGGGAVGGGNDLVFYENDMVVTTNYTLTANKNAMSAGPVTINSGVTVTVPTGAVWTIV